jgi:hypothetical protein
MTTLRQRLLRLEAALDVRAGPIREEPGAQDLPPLEDYARLATCIAAGGGPPAPCPVPTLSDLWPCAESIRQFLDSTARAPEGVSAGW